MSRSSGKKTLRIAVVSIFALLGAWNLGQAGYILVKAELAQTLLEAAWERSRAGAVGQRPWG